MEASHTDLKPHWGAHGGADQGRPSKRGHSGWSGRS
jgi:hypothetical protein